jgi:uncharacterized metal-binding protein YceD (DUF177 family)
MRKDCFEYMSKYKCDCGGRLEMHQEETFEEIKKLLTNGKLSKKRILRDSGVSGASWLECVECNKEYEYDVDGTGRFFKAEGRFL